MFEKIQSYLANQLDISPDDITRDTTFESLGIDSLDTVEMVMDLVLIWNLKKSSRRWANWSNLWQASSTERF